MFRLQHRDQVARRGRLRRNERLLERVEVGLGLCGARGEDLGRADRRRVDVARGRQGRRPEIETDFEYTEFEVDRKIAYTITKPFPMTATVRFEPVADGTRVSESVEGEPGGFFKLAEPLVVKMSQRQFQSDFDNLRDLMEANAL